MFESALELLIQRFHTIVNKKETNYLYVKCSGLFGNQGHSPVTQGYISGVHFQVFNY